MKLVQRVFCSLNSAWKAVRRSCATLRREYLVEQYIRSGAQFGDSVSRLYTGECVDLQAAHRHWAFYERQYAQLGFRTIAPGEFVEYGAFGKSIDHLLRVGREPDEQPILHAPQLQHLNPEELGSLPEFGSSQNHPTRCELGEVADPAAVAHPQSCNLADCRLRREHSRQDAGRLWRF